MRQLFYIMGVIQALFIAACGSNIPEFPVKNTVGYTPIYESQLPEIIVLQSPRTIFSAGRVVSYKDMIFLNDKGLGIHIIDNANPYLPKKKGFIAIPGNRDFAIRNEVLYVDFYRKIVNIDISNPNQISILNWVKFKDYEYNSRPPFNGYFICAEPSKGPIVAWAYGPIRDPKCGTPNAILN